VSLNILFTVSYGRMSNKLQCVIFSSLLLSPSFQIRGPFCNISQNSDFCGEGFLAPVPNASWRTTSYRLTTIAYSVYSQLPSVPGGLCGKMRKDHFHLQVKYTFQWILESRKTSAWKTQAWILRVGCGGMDWIDLAQDRDRWRGILTAVMNLRVP
jgi:hypothetical protein